jgi:membrane-bound ClpP family serine protease
MSEWIIVLLVIGAVISALAWLLYETGAQVLEWLFKILGMSGKGDVPAGGLSSSEAVIKTPFVVEPGAADAKGSVEFRGELWAARCTPSDASSLQVGERCAVVDSEGLMLIVRKKWNEAV